MLNKKENEIIDAKDNIEKHKALRSIKADELCELLVRDYGNKKTYDAKEVIDIIHKTYTLGFVRGGKDKAKEVRNTIKEFYTLAQVSDELNLNIQTLRIYVKEGCEGVKLNAYKLGHTYYTTREDIKEFLQNFKASE